MFYFRSDRNIYFGRSSSVTVVETLKSGTIFGQHFALFAPDFFSAVVAIETLYRPRELSVRQKKKKKTDSKTKSTLFAANFSDESVVKPTPRPDATRWSSGIRLKIIALLIVENRNASSASLKTPNEIRCAVRIAR